METKENSAAPGAQATPSTDGSTHCGSGHRRHRGRRFLAVLLIALTAGVAGGYIGKSFAGGRHFMGMSGDSAKRDAQVERMVKRFASRVDATPEQQAKLTDIARGAARDIAPVRDKLRDARRQALEIARAPAVDRAALEKFRAEQLQLADSVSKRMTQALADAAEVLTPEQRQKVTGRWAERMQRRDRG